jgi:REP element-mobilizing transposase RayT
MYKSLKRFYNKNEDEKRIYFITFVTKSRIEFFDIKIFKDIFRRNLLIAQSFHKFYIYSYTIQNEHIHLLIQPLNNKSDISVIMKFIKKNFSYNINYLSKEDIVGADNIPRRLNNNYSILQQEIIEKHWQFLLELKKT